MLSTFLLDDASQILATSFPNINGLQFLQAYQTSSGFSSCDDQSRNVVQIHFNDALHFLVSFRPAGEQRIRIYDSLYNRLNRSMEKQLAQIYGKNQGSLTVDFYPVHRQSDGSSCGVFAIANATALCHGLDPTTLVYDEPLIRNRLLACFASGIFDPSDPS